MDAIDRLGRDYVESALGRAELDGPGQSVLILGGRHGSPGSKIIHVAFLAIDLDPGVGGATVFHHQTVLADVVAEFTVIVDGKDVVRVSESASPGDDFGVVGFGEALVSALEIRGELSGAIVEQFLGFVGLLGTSETLDGDVGKIDCGSDSVISEIVFASFG